MNKQGKGFGGFWIGVIILLLIYLGAGLYAHSIDTCKNALPYDLVFGGLRLLSNGINQQCFEGFLLH